eukprot:5121185-Amphidinium_carterae.1
MMCAWCTNIDVRSASRTFSFKDKQCYHPELCLCIEAVSFVPRRYSYGLGIAKPEQYNHDPPLNMIAAEVPQAISR